MHHTYSLKTWNQIIKTKYNSLGLVFKNIQSISRDKKKLEIKNNLVFKSINIIKAGIIHEKKFYKISQSTFKLENNKTNTFEKNPSTIDLTWTSRFPEEEEFKKPSYEQSLFLQKKKFPFKNSKVSIIVIEDRNKKCLNAELFHYLPCKIFIQSQSLLELNVCSILISFLDYSRKNLMICNQIIFSKEFSLHFNFGNLPVSHIGWFLGFRLFCKFHISRNKRKTNQFFKIRVPTNQIYNYFQRKYEIHLNSYDLKNFSKNKYNFYFFLHLSSGFLISRVVENSFHRKIAFKHLFTRSSLVEKVKNEKFPNIFANSIRGISDFFFENFENNFQNDGNLLNARKKLSWYFTNDNKNNIEFQNVLDIFHFVNKLQMKILLQKFTSDEPSVSLSEIVFISLASKTAIKIQRGGIKKNKKRNYYYSNYFLKPYAQEGYDIGGYELLSCLLGYFLGKNFLNINGSMIEIFLTFGILFNAKIMEEIENNSPIKEWIIEIRKISRSERIKMLLK